MRSFFAFLFLAVGFLGVSAQQSSRSAVELAELRRSAQKILSEVPHRIKITIEMRESQDSDWEQYSYQVREVVPPDSSYLIQHTGLRLEVIKIGHSTYQRSHGGQWTSVAVGSQSGYTGATITELRPRTEQVSEIDPPTASQAASKAFQTRFASTIQLNRNGRVLDLEGTRMETFDGSGRFSRIEYLHFNFERKKFQRNIEEFEYDPTIKIEPPVN